MRPVKNKVICMNAQSCMDECTHQTLHEKTEDCPSGGRDCGQCIEWGVPHSVAIDDDGNKYLIPISGTEEDRPHTPAPEHCDHEEICRFFFHDSKVAYIDGTRCMRNHEGCAKCTYDSRPCTPAPDRTNQCKTCRFEGSRKCMSHGYPENEIPKSCQYKIGKSAFMAQCNMCTEARTAALAAYQAISDAIENQKDHKEFLLSRDTKNVVLDIIDAVRSTTAGDEHHG